MRRKRQRNIFDWEASLIKAMLSRSEFNRDQIISYFTRPDRQVNAARINEIASNSLFGDIEPASVEQLDAYISAKERGANAENQFFQMNPLHPGNLSALFGYCELAGTVMAIDESDRVECKESLSLNFRAVYARTIAAFANAHGGYILFGIRNEQKVVVGIKEGRLCDYDSARLNQFLAEHFSPVPIWEKVEYTIEEKTVGVIYVRRSALSLRLLGIFRADLAVADPASH
jgi:hypothetical protein